MVIKPFSLISILYFSGLLLLSGAVNADDERGAHFISVQLENDSINNKNDGYYTNGMEVSLLRGEELPPEWLQSVANWIPFYQNGTDLNFVSYSFGQKLYTPLETEVDTLVVNERPYAAYLYTTMAIMSRIDHDDRFDSGNMLELTLGLVGPSALGEETQNTIHRLLGYDRSYGWGHQLQDELTMGITYSRLWRMVRKASAGLEYGVNSHLTFALGNAETYGSAGLMLRLGDNLRRDLNPPNIRPSFPGVSYYQSLEGVDWYGFLGHEVRWVGRDIFLDGNTFVDSHRVAKEPWVGDTQYGIVFVHRDIRLSLSTTVRTREFKAQQEDSTYRAINVSFRY